MAEKRDRFNGIHFKPGDTEGHYESYFQRANHPEKPLAFWIRYTVFCPKLKPQDAVGELWGIYFDGETRSNTAVKEVFPISECGFSETRLAARIGRSTLSDSRLEGSATSGSHKLSWSLDYVSDQQPLLLLPERLYETGFPKAKALVEAPGARFTGTMEVDGTRVKIDRWCGSQNHNWGRKHTDSYAWGQVAGFDNAADAFLECSTARVKIGPLWTPWFTMLVLRLDGEEFALNSLWQSLRARGKFHWFHWDFESSKRSVRIKGRMHAPNSAFVGLWYDNPPGGRKTCLNTKIATCSVTVERPGRSTLRLVTNHRAAFEILTDRTDHGVPIVA